MGSRIQSFLAELRRRNVLRVGAAFLVAGWVALQIVDILGPALGLPDWSVIAVAVVIAVGLPTALVVAWYFEITSSGLVPTHQVPPEASITPKTGRSIDRLIIMFLAIALAFFVTDALLTRVSQTQRADPATPVQGYNSLALLPEVEVEPILAQLAAEVVGMLDKVPNLPVTPMEVVGNLRVRSPFDVVASELGVQYLLLFQRSRQNVSRFQVSLYDAIADETIWTMEYDPDLQNALTLQTEISVEVVRRLGVLTDTEAKTLLSRPTNSAEAFAHYLRGQLLLSGDSIDFQGVEQQFRRAIDLDERFALPYAGLCRLYIRRFDYSRDSVDFEEAEKNCYRAMTLGRFRGAVHEALGGLYLASGQPVRAEEAYLASLQTNPSSIVALVGYADALEHQGSLAEAESFYKKAISTQPSYSPAYNALAVHYYHLGDYGRAIEQLEIAKTIAPESPSVSNNLAAFYVVLGKFDVAIALLKPIVDSSDATIGHVLNLGTAYYFQGAYDDAVRQYQRAATMQPSEGSSYRNLGDAYLALTEDDLARKAFREAVARSEAVLKLNPGQQEALVNSAVAYASLGEEEEFARIEPSVKGLAEHDPESAYQLAVCYCRLGRIEDCQLEIGISFKGGFPYSILKADPALKEAFQDDVWSLPPP